MCRSEPQAPLPCAVPASYRSPEPPVNLSLTLRILASPPSPTTSAFPGMTASEHSPGTLSRHKDPPGAAPPTHDEDGHEAGQCGVPVPAARGRCLAHQHAVEDEISKAQLHAPCGEEESETIVLEAPGGSGRDSRHQPDSRGSRGRNAGALRGPDGVAPHSARFALTLGQGLAASEKLQPAGKGRGLLDWVTCNRVVKSWHV